MKCWRAYGFGRKDERGIQLGAQVGHWPGPPLGADSRSAYSGRTRLRSRLRARMKWGKTPPAQGKRATA
jgi:hypothetical protein